MNKTKSIKFLENLGYVFCQVIEEHVYRFTKDNENYLLLPNGRQGVFLPVIVGKHYTLVNEDREID